MNKNDSFSVRMGFEPKQEMQINDLNEPARTALFNVLDRCIMKNDTDMWQVIGENFFHIRYNKIIEYTPEGYRNQMDIDCDVVDERTQEIIGMYDEIYIRWYRIFDFTEFVYVIMKEKINEASRNEKRRLQYKKLTKLEADINSVLREHVIGYTFINGKFIPLTDEEQLAELAKAAATPYQNANEHIKKATQLFSNRTKPDYANSIKESISAVESAAVELTGEENTTLGQAIKALKANGINLHPAFEEALSKLYGFTSDSAGIRHGGTGEPLQQDQATARFMLITCSAFVNYIIANAPTKK
ncbi:MAG: hypothetical protein K0U19_06500 [Proteobacteria bacterium]|nr:hypothetical protein [Pseudomonadota bacterium]